MIDGIRVMRAIRMGWLSCPRVDRHGQGFLSEIIEVFDVGLRSFEKSRTRTVFSRRMRDTLSSMACATVLEVSAIPPMVRCQARRAA